MTSDRHTNPSADELAARIKRDLAEAAGAQVDAGLLAGLMAAPAATPSADELSAAALAALRPEMTRRAAVILRRRVFVRVLLALVPLPLVLAYAGYVLQALYLPISVMLSPDVAGYIAAGHVLFLTLLFGATYAAIPMMLSRPNSRAVPAIMGRAG